MALTLPGGDDDSLVCGQRRWAHLVVCLCFMFMAPSLFWLSVILVVVLLVYYLSVILVVVHRSHTRCKQCC